MRDSFEVSTGNRYALLGVGTPIVAILLVVAGWAIDGGTGSESVLRNTTIAGRDISGMSAAELQPVLTQIDGSFVTTRLRVVTPEAELTTTTGEVGLAVDTAATTSASLRVGRDGPAIMRPLVWFTSFFSSREASVQVHIDTEQVRTAAEELAAESRIDPREPAIEYRGGDLTLVGGRAGVALDSGALEAALSEVVDVDVSPITVEVATTALEPEISDEEAETVFSSLIDATDQPFELRIGDQQRVLAGSRLRPLLRAEAVDGVLVVAVDPENTMSQVRTLFADVGEDPVPAKPIVREGEVVIDGGESGTQCCAPETPDAVLAAIENGDSIVDLELAELPPEQDEAYWVDLGVRERVGGFTTRMQAGQDRVRNIHRIADIVRGTIVHPGETFSINETVGRRTKDKGFVEAGVIYKGVFTDDVGGGISQFATTLFNAAFFSGLDYGEYQSHSIYISRYPYGREATLSFPNPDLQIVNDTPYAVMIWPTYTGASITVDLYSTPWADTTQTGQSERAQGACTRVTTFRSRTILETEEVLEDSVFAVYRPSEGLDCAGNKTIPDPPPCPEPTEGEDPQAPPPEDCTPVEPDPAPDPEGEGDQSDGDGDGDDQSGGDQSGDDQSGGDQSGDDQSGGGDGGGDPPPEPTTTTTAPATTTTVVGDGETGDDNTGEDENRG